MLISMVPPRTEITTISSVQPRTVYQLKLCAEMGRSASSTPNSMTTRPNVMMMHNGKIENEVAAVHAKASILCNGYFDLLATRAALVWNRHLRLSDPAQEAVSFPHLSQAIEAVPRNQAESARIGGEALLHEAPHQSVKQPCRELLEPAFTVAHQSGGIRHIIALVITANHLMNHRLRLLQVGIDHNYGVDIAYSRPSVHAIE